MAGPTGTVECGGSGSISPKRAQRGSHPPGERPRGPWSAAAQRRARVVGGHGRLCLLPGRHHAGGHHRRHPGGQRRLGFVNEYRAERATAALHSHGAPQRGRAPRRELTKVDVTELVPGDVVRLASVRSCPPTCDCSRRRPGMRRKRPDRRVTRREVAAPSDPQWRWRFDGSGVHGHHRRRR